MTYFLKDNFTLIYISDTVIQPIQDVNDSAFACNKDITHQDSTIINIPAGAKVGAWWGHVIGGAQIANDPDNPIAPSHKGPIMVYL